MMTVETVPVAKALVAFGVENVRVVVVRDTLGELTMFVAQGLERDIAAQGRTIEQALDRLASTADVDWRLSLSRQRQIDAAPLHVFEWYRQAPDRADGSLAGGEQVRSDGEAGTSEPSRAKEER